MAMQRPVAPLILSSQRLGTATLGTYGVVATDRGSAIDAETTAVASTLAVVVGVFFFASFFVLDLVAASYHRGGNPDHQEPQAQHHHQKTLHSKSPFRNRAP